jgi:hypothetical protein
MERHAKRKVVTNGGRDDLVLGFWVVAMTMISAVRPREIRSRRVSSSSVPVPHACRLACKGSVRGPAMTYKRQKKRSGMTSEAPHSAPEFRRFPYCLTPPGVFGRRLRRRLGSRLGLSAPKARISARVIPHFETTPRYGHHMGRPRVYAEPRVATAIRLPTSIRDELMTVATERDVSVNFLVTRAVTDYLRRLPEVSNDDQLRPRTRRQRSAAKASS